MSKLLSQGSGQTSVEGLGFSRDTMEEGGIQHCSSSELGSGSFPGQGGSNLLPCLPHLRAPAG